MLDVIISPEIKENYIFSLRASYFKGKYDPAIITYVEKSEVGYWKVLYAWKVDIKKEKIEKINTDGITSMNTTFKD